MSIPVVLKNMTGILMSDDNSGYGYQNELPDDNSGCRVS